MPPTIFISLGMYDDELDFLEKLVNNHPNMSYYTLLNKNPYSAPSCVSEFQVSHCYHPLSFINMNH